MDKREFKDSVYSEISKVAKALSNSHRLEIVNLLSNGPKSVEHIALETGINFANASQHLQLLKRERLVSTQKKGNYVLYSLSHKKVYDAYKSILELALKISPQINIEKETFRNKFHSIETISYHDVVQRDDICLIDVRPKDEFLISHFPKAVSVPIEKLSSSINNLPKDKLIVAYCRGMFCTYADEAVKLLLENGYSALRMEESGSDL